MGFNLRNTYSLHITISFELNDVSSHENKQKRGETNGDNYVLTGSILSKHHQHD